jgi:uncharacterized phage-associated protein
MWSQEKALNAVLVVANLIGRADFHKVFKIFYFADREHLATYGRTILGDQYVAMKDGPVPSNTYDFLKAFRGEGFASSLSAAAKERLHVDRFVVIPKSQADEDHLSESEIACLKHSIQENKDLSFGQLSEKSHDYAWGRASMNNEMALLDIAQEANASDEMLQYIREIQEAEEALKWL